MRKLIVALLLLVVLAAVGAAAVLHLAPARFYEFSISAMRAYAGLERKEATLPDGTRMVYLEGGHGEPMLLLHGFGANKDNFLAIAPYLRNHYRLIVPDIVGFGESAKPLPADYSPSAQVERLHALLQQIGIREPVHVGGNSMGGLLALQYGQRYSSETASLWPMDPAGIFSSPRTEYMRVAAEEHRNPFDIRSGADLGRLMSKAFAKPPYIPGPILDMQAREFAANRPVMEAVFAATMSSNIEKAVDGLPLPTLIVWGDEDQFVHPAGAAILHRLLPNSTVVMLHHVGHIPQMEAPRETSQAFLDFAQAHPTQAHR